MKRSVLTLVLLSLSLARAQETGIPGPDAGTRAASEAKDAGALAVTPMDGGAVAVKLEDAGTSLAPLPVLTGEIPIVQQAFLSRKDATAQLVKLLASLGNTSKPSCDLVDEKSRFLVMFPGQSNEEIKAAMPQYLALARCAEKKRYFILMVDVALKMNLADPTHAHGELLVRAMLGLNKVDKAKQALDALRKQSPQDVNLALTAAKVDCRSRDWKACLTHAGETLKLAKENVGGLPADEITEVKNRAWKYRARASLHLGDLKGAAGAIAEAEKTGGEVADLDALREALSGARSFGAVVETELAEDVPLGIYHLLGKRPGSRPLVRVYLDSVVSKDRPFLLSAELLGVSTKLERTVTLFAKRSAVVDLTPILKPDFNAAHLRARQAVQLNVVVALAGDSPRTVVARSQEVGLLPHDFLPTGAYTDHEHNGGTMSFDYIAAWVTPNSRAVDIFLRNAKKRAPSETFAGEQTATVPQVRALYDELQAHGFSYVMDPTVLAGDSMMGQRTRLPSESLASTNAQCLEGAILYATLMEAIGLRPSVILVPGHAFVSWMPSSGDHLPPGRAFFLETTMTHTKKFEDAVAAAAGEYARAAKYHQATVVSIPDQRAQGVTPQPYE